MKKLFNLLLIIVPFCLKGQTTSAKAKFKEIGIHWVEDITWQEVLAKAKKENKFIFVDVYATWCGPCKKMDKEVYPNDTVGAFMNERFVSVKVQIDSTKNDPDQVKQWYKVAHNFVEEYNIIGVPSFLFFSPDGKIVHKGNGGLKVNEFVNLAANSLNPDLQYYSLIRKFQAGVLEQEAVKKLAHTAKEIGDEEMSFNIVRQYMHSYLDKLSIEQYVTKDNFTFLTSFIGMLNTNERFFEVCFKYPRYVDSIMRKGFANDYVNYLIFQTLLTPRLESAVQKKSTPNWKQCFKIIKRKYGETYAKQNVLNAKIKWYKFKEDWTNLTKSIVQVMQLKDLANISPSIINGNAWQVFLHSNDKRELEEALIWAEYGVKAMETEAKPSKVLLVALMDTKVNLIYKLGRKEEALSLYQKVVALWPEFTTTYEKMKQGLPTWQIN